MNLPTASEPSLTLQNGQPSSAAIRCQLVRAADRWQSRITLLPAGSADPILLLESVEGDKHTDWPPSPTLQDCQQLPSLPNAILATGMAGVAHWSAALEVPATGGMEPPTECICWDVACRIRKPPSNPESDEIARLESSYRIGPTVTASLKDGNLRLRSNACAGADCRLSALPTDAENPLAVIKLIDQGSEKTVQITVTEAVELGQPPQTVRWKYRLGFV